MFAVYLTRLILPSVLETLVNTGHRQSMTLAAASEWRASWGKGAGRLGKGRERTNEAHDEAPESRTSDPKQISELARGGGSPAAV